MDCRDHSTDCRPEIPLTRGAYSSSEGRSGSGSAETTAARTFRALVSELPALQLLPADARHHAAVLRKLDALRGCKLTYVDASSSRTVSRVAFGSAASISTGKARRRRINEDRTGMRKSALQAM